MADPSLELVRQKVERGERLSDSELETLRHAAQVQGGPTLKLALAQALLNLEHGSTALPILENLRRDYPRDVQVVLGLARAYVSLERYADSERTLEEALRVNPNDPEAMKGIAVLALRRGEHRRARRLVHDVLRMDPLDDEARLLREELSAAELSNVAAPAVVEPAAFNAALEERLRALGARFSKQDGELLVKVDEERVARVDLASMYTTYQEEAQPLAAAVEAIAKELAELSSGLPKTADALLKQALPVLRRGEFTERAPGAAQREGPAGLSVFYVLDHPELVRYVPLSLLEELDVSLDQLDARAFENLDCRPPLPRQVRIDNGQLRLTHVETGLWALCEGDGYDSARLLTAVRENLFEQLGRGALRVALGSRELVVLCREEDATSVRSLESLPVAPDGIAGHYRLGPDGLLTRF